MARNLLSDARVKGARPRMREYLLADGEGLNLRVRPDGSRSWIFRARFNGKLMKLGLGVYPAVTLADARELADRKREQVRRGVDPREARKLEVRNREAEAQRQAARPTVRQFFVEYRQRQLSMRKDRGVNTLRLFEKDVFPLVGERPIEEIQARDIRPIIDRVVDRGARRMAGVLLSELRQMFRYAISREAIGADPTAALRKADFGGNGVPRDRVLSESEIAELARRLPESGLSPATRAAIWVMLATCARVGELTRAQWDDVDLDRCEWRIPAENAKNRRAHLIHLSPFAVNQFRSLPREARSPYVFPGLSGTHANRQRIEKAIRDRQRTAQIEGRARADGALLLDARPWTAHDLRRTGATLMGELGIRPEVIDRALNHVNRNIVTQTYQRQELLEERRQAFAALGEKLEALLRAQRPAA